MKALVDVGHDVTIVSPFYEEYNITGNGSYRQIVLTGIAEAQKGKYGTIQSVKAEFFFNSSSSQH